MPPELDAEHHKDDIEAPTFYQIWASNEIYLCDDDYVKYLEWKELLRKEYNKLSRVDKSCLYGSRAAFISWAETIIGIRRDPLWPLYDIYDTITSLANAFVSSAIHKKTD